MAGTISSPWPQRLAALCWDLLTPHLLRRGLYQAGIENRNGSRPLIVQIVREPFGERVRLWCPPGTSAEDLRRVRPILCAACCAADIQVRSDGLHPQMVTVDVIRRRSDTGADDG